MTWFLNTRSEPSGGDVSPVKITDGALTYPVYPDLLKLIQGRDLLIATHGFNVSQAAGVDHLSEWSRMLDLGGGVFLGALWPGDSTWLGALEYPFAAKAATNAGNSLAAFINANFTGALSISFASHSLGARVVLQAIRGLAKSFTVRRLVLMAAAIDDDCLTIRSAASSQPAIPSGILLSDATAHPYIPHPTTFSRPGTFQTPGESTTATTCRRKHPIPPDISPLLTPCRRSSHPRTFRPHPQVLRPHISSAAIGSTGSRP
jgi:hypothetical protein